MSFLLKHSYTERIAKNNEELIDFISTNLIDETISEKGEATVYTPKEQKKEIPIFVASSMVNEVVPVIKALTDSDKVDFIFYDEVETSMHPLKQIEMVKLLNCMNNKGIRLIVSTHSDTMATKINNLLLLSHGDFDFDVTKKIFRKKSNTNRKRRFTGLIGDTCVSIDFSLFNDSTMNLFEEAKIAMGIDDEN